MTSYVLAIKNSALQVFSALPTYIIRKQKARLRASTCQELSERNTSSPFGAEIRSSLSKGRYSLASLTSSIGGSTHDGCCPGNLAVGDAENSLDLFKVDCESFREGECKPNWDGGSKHHSPAPSTVGGDIAQVGKHWRRHGQSRSQSKPCCLVSCRAEKRCVGTECSKHVVRHHSKAN